MSYEMVVGLNLTNEKIYADYRNAMAPILKEFGGGFRFDFRVAEVLKSEENKPINRVFTIHFKDKKNMDAFFSDNDYLKVKQSFFEKSVDSVTIISEYEKS